jgi:hypothetical protein
MAGMQILDEKIERAWCLFFYYYWKVSLKGVVYSSWIIITQYLICISDLKGLCQSKLVLNIGMLCFYYLYVTAGLVLESI